MARLASPAVLAPTVAALYRAWSATWRYEFCGRRVLQDAVAGGPAVLAFWHGEQMAMVRAHAGMGLVGMASLSSDGDLLARVIGRLGYRVVRGSSSRGGRAALGECIGLMRREGCSIALAVDGPRGPRHRPQLGALAAAAATRRPVIYGVSDAVPGLCLPSWDRFVVPLPGARVRVCYGRMDPPPPDRPSLLEACEALRDGMEALARDGRAPA